MAMQKDNSVFDTVICQVRRLLTMKSSKHIHTNQTEPLVEMFIHLGRPHAVPLILTLGERASNADIREIRSSISASDRTRVSEDTISKCLSGLASVGLVRESVHTHSPSRAEYSLTDSGQEVYRHLLQMRYLAENGASGEISIGESISAC